MEIGLNIRLPRKNTALIFHLIVTGVVQFIYCHIYWFNQYKCNIKLNGEGRRVFKQVKLIEHFFLCSHNGTHEDFKVQIIGHCDSNGQEVREDFWIFHLDTLHPQGLNQKCSLKYWIRARWHNTRSEFKRFKISLRIKVPVRCKVTSWLPLTWVQAKWNSLRCISFHLG